MSKAYWNSELDMTIKEEWIKAWKQDDAPASYERFLERNGKWCLQNGLKWETPTFEEYCGLVLTEFKTPYEALEARFEHMKAMNTIVRNMNDESAYYGSWVYLVPDEADDSDLYGIADNDEDFDEVCRMFVRIISRYGKSGFYVYDYSTKAWGVQKNEDKKEDA